jgi:hypothetical protein
VVVAAAGAVHMPVPVLLGVRVIVVVRVMTMAVIMVMPMIRPLPMIMPVVVVVVIMVVVIMGMVIMGMVIMGMVIMGRVPVIVAAGAVVVGGTLGAERPGDRGREAALSAHQLRRGRGRRHVEHVRGDLGGHMAAAELPGQTHQPGRVLGAHLQEVLRGRPHRDEAAVVEAQGIAVLEGRGLRERHGEAEPALGDQGPRDRLPTRVVEAHRVGDAVGAHRRPADDRGGCRHGTPGNVAGSGAAALRPGRRLWRVA